MYTKYNFRYVFTSLRGGLRRSYSLFTQKARSAARVRDSSGTTKPRSGEGDGADSPTAAVSRSMLRLYRRRARPKK